MQQSRSYTVRKKAKIVLDKKFDVPFYNSLNVGDVGQIKLKGVVIAERKELVEDDTERFCKTIEVESVELINKRDDTRDSNTAA